ncbi:tyrosine recombinase XerC [Verrucomicrobium sp. 3C]|uniref:site-specific integrase n=1 Tax=Verrucomicrobium sp. 3C TaxID=1134055 RepID=UPI0003826F0B|nr:tyrosine-type recombinase/integrase [Verrucomicrobium sp. 3C]
MRELLAEFETEPLAAVREWVEAKRLLQSCGGNVIDAARELAERRAKETASLPMEQAYERFLEYKEAAKLRPRAIASLRSDLSRFVNAFPDRLVSSISAADISDYVAARGELEPLTRLSILRRVGAFMNWCGKRGWCEKGIMADIEKPKIRSAQTHIFTPDEVRALLEAASNVAPEMVPYLALGLFCGLRTAELDRLDWRYVNGKEVRIEADVAKTASRRVVPIPENAAAWLAPYRRKSGPVRPPNSRRKLGRVIAASGVSWKPNAMRHSFASYRLAQCKDAPRVSLELGHMSPALVFRHYRALVSEEDAQRYFSIRPPAASSNVIPIAAGQR